MDKFQQTVQDIAAFFVMYDDSDLSDDAKEIIVGISNIFNKNSITIGVYSPKGVIEKIGVN